MSKSNEQRATSNEQRAKSNEQRALSKKVSLVLNCHWPSGRVLGAEMKLEQLIIIFITLSLVC